jgi:NAD(P)-dependent dehydrogenase (short-subunit alcohol dehydrogenase family)
MISRDKTDEQKTKQMLCQQHRGRMRCGGLVIQARRLRRSAFLASPDSSFMTGSEVFVDGGFAQI